MSFKWPSSFSHMLITRVALVLLMAHSCLQMSLEQMDNACLYATDCKSNELCINLGNRNYDCVDSALLQNSSPGLRMLSAAKKKLAKKVVVAEEEPVLALPTAPSKGIKDEELAPEDTDETATTESDEATLMDDEKTEKPEEKKEDEKLDDDSEAARKLKTEKQLSLINLPAGFDKKYLNFDPCLSSPCLFGKICHKMDTAPAGFICLNELDHSVEISDARKIYRNMELLAKEAVILNMNTMGTQQLPMTKSTPRTGFSTNLRASSKKTRKNPCMSSPCLENEVCDVSKDAPNGFVCIKQEKTLVKNDNEAISKLMNDEKFVEDMIDKCRKLHGGERIAIEKEPTRFVECLGKEEFTIVNCPDDFPVFNKHLDRCDVDAEPVTLGCRSSPCQFGSKCIDLPGLEYKCQCVNGFSGVNCEIGPDVCSTNPCGSKGFCHAQPSSAPIAYYCSCADEQFFGLNCDNEKTLERNPCGDVDAQNALFPTNLDPSVFVHCDLHTFNLRYCQKGKQLDKDDMTCKWIDMSHPKKKTTTMSDVKKMITKRYI